MTKKCIYCQTELHDDRSLDVCDRCGINVWGEKMFNAILQNMNNARERGDLCNSNLSEREPPSKFGNTRVSFG